VLLSWSFEAARNLKTLSAGIFLNCFESIEPRSRTYIVVLYSPFAHFYQVGRYAGDNSMTKKYNAREKKQRRLAKERRKQERVKEAIAKAAERKQ